MATTSVNNRFIREIERRGPRPQFGDVAYTGAERADAKRITDANARMALMTNPSGAGVAGGKDWQDFEQYHGYQRQLAAGRGGRHTVNGASISGGGDLNQRAASGDSPTFQVNGGGMPALAMSTLRRTAGMDEDLGDYQHRREMERLARESGGETVRAGRLRNDAVVDNLQTERDAMNLAPGTPGWYDAQRSRSGLKNELAYDATMNAADAESDAYWKHGRSALVDQTRLQDEAGNTAHTRALELQSLRSAPAMAAVTQRQSTGDAATDQRLLTASINALTQQINNARQYGDDETVTRLQPELDALVTLAAPAGRAPQTGAPSAAPRAGATPPRPANVPPNGYYDPAGPDGPGWYVDE